MWTTCFKCKKLFEGGVCECGWHKSSTLQIKKYAHLENPQYVKKYVDRLKERGKVKDLEINAPRLQAGASRDEVRHFWIRKMRSCL